ncbi:helix-turn-helix domain-containing protein [Haloarcula laminariae]|uniref:helix-turn-helix domain-containing protein n=1 Tax=Haloarcula laminariae TaxID=2961577 RepID=UPI002404D473|nr:helix-turn-helix domain-containing protein [Halomicroarcula sp. FL173]
MGHGVYTGPDQPAKGRFSVYADSIDEVERLIEWTRESNLTGSVMEVEQDGASMTREATAPGNATREIFVEFDPENSIDNAFISRGFVYDGPTQIENGQETWMLVAHHGRQTVSTLLDEIRDEEDADITVTHISTSDHAHRRPGADASGLSARQREIFHFARDNGYYEWPRESSARELAAECDISKTTFLEHLRKAEAKLLASVDPP